MGKEATLAFTPTWVVAIVCLVIVSISLAAERSLHYLGKYLECKKQKALFSALQRLKEELMLLGFISFVLSLSQGFIVSICIPETSTDFMLPCNRGNSRVAEEGAKICNKKGDVPLLSLEALHQLHIFIFVLGLVHVVFCATTISFSGAKMRKWKHWETEIHREVHEKLQQEKNEGQGSSLSIVVLHREHQDEFVHKRTKGFWMKLAVASWITAFLKQFQDSVSKSDYEALRSAFVVEHYPEKPDIDFHKYMTRAVEYEFKRVVGISWYLWLFVILFLLLNINGWHTYFWLAFLPLFLLLIVGAKLEHIITRLAQEAAISLSNNTEEVPKIKPCKDHFWFHKPELVLHLIHFILFQNSFEISFFFWILVSEGFGSCMMERKPYVISRLVIGVIIEVICSYITLPLYAIVTHMTGQIKLHGFGSRVHESVHGWIGLRKKPFSFWKIPGGDPNADSGREADVTRRVAKERSGSSRSMPMAPADEIVTVDDVAVAAAAVGQGP
ncbi:barley mlo defense gene homolog 7 [Zea mays]|uniref:MLO-like protein n=1 Tax=Zea mays TaxID=4577 RepID=Q94CG8_MAIZE|nr:barley mlo defense gene homolog 7 [Zea mays]AAK38343.1 seven transmembrane protein Mlo7 [Zea mays]|eukprot:NP_001105661.1 barley mlo defense gene homolog 7 [Zea mays]